MIDIRQLDDLVAVLVVLETLARGGPGAQTSP
jgi:hypothetical protein